jgi:hypothetical protein
LEVAVLVAPQSMARLAGGAAVERVTTNLVSAPPTVALVFTVAGLAVRELVQRARLFLGAVGVPVALPGAAAMAQHQAAAVAQLDRAQRLALALVANFVFGGSFNESTSN